MVLGWFYKPPCFLSAKLKEINQKSIQHYNPAVFKLLIEDMEKGSS